MLCELCAWSGSLRQAATRLRAKKGVFNADLVLRNIIFEPPSVGANGHSPLQPYNK